MAYVTVIPGGPGDLRHGYTLADLDRIARSATSHVGTMASDYTDRLHTAWSAIVEHLYAADHPPAEHDLWHTGRHAIWGEIRSSRRFQGAPVKDLSAGSGEMPSFRRFWWDYASAVPSPEARIVERHALAQIWPQLTDRERQAVLAFAANGSVQAAAEALQITTGAMNSRLQNARRRFLAWWHEGETPSRKWRMDSGPRRTGQPLKPCGTPSAYIRHRRRGEVVDDVCRSAWTAYLADRAASRRENAAGAEAQR